MPSWGKAPSQHYLMSIKIYDDNYFMTLSEILNKSLEFIWARKLSPLGSEGARAIGGNMMT